jgi:hypothetical protein
MDKITKLFGGMGKIPGTSIEVLEACRHGTSFIVLVKVRLPVNGQWAEPKMRLDLDKEMFIDYPPDELAEQNLRDAAKVIARMVKRDLVR